MTYAIALEFDIEVTERINKKIIEIAESNINPYMVSNKIPPHLTLSLFEVGDELGLHNVLKYICGYVTGELVEIHSVGMFEPKVIYYALKNSDFLIGLNEMTTNKLIEIGIRIDEYYLPDKWVPHIALGVQLTSNELRQALGVVERDFEPFTTIIEKVVLAKCNPYKEIVECII
jgi:2'-5' RNA ligase